MRNAETVLGIIQQRGKRGQILEDVYRLLYNRNLYLYAYGRIYQNDGAMTRGVTAETVDGMSQAKIDSIIENLRCERFRWTPVRRVYIPKSNGKMRPLGIPTWTDKLLQEVIRLILEAYFEPRFSSMSHGFRPERGCHTALNQVHTTWNGVKWFIEGDIKGFFDNIDHTVMLSILREKIHDERFLRLVANLLEAGYLEEWRFTPTRSGTPQGGVISPLLSNIYLNKFDEFVECELIPPYCRGKRRTRNPECRHIEYEIRKARVAGDSVALRHWKKLQRQTDTYDYRDPDFRRLKYVRYADDFLMGFIGPKDEATEIKSLVRTWLQDNLKLELSEEKTLITHANTEAAKFLGYELSTFQSPDRPTVNGKIRLAIPEAKVNAICSRYMKNGKPAHRPERTVNSDFDIIAGYGIEYRGFMNYYLLAHNIERMTKVHWVMRLSLLMTLANKHRSSVARMYKRFSSTVNTPHGPKKCIQVIVDRPGKSPLFATFGGIPFRRRKDFHIEDGPTQQVFNQRTELVMRLRADRCEVCGSTENVEVHHVRKLADLKKKGREPDLYQRLMAAWNRKTLVLCERCHDDAHAGRLNIPPKDSK